MGLIDRLRGTETDSAQTTAIDHYELKVETKEGGRQLPTNYFTDFETQLAQLDEIDVPPEKDEIKNTAESEGWPSGRYILEKKSARNTILGFEWEFEHEGTEGKQREEMDTEERLLQELRGLKDSESRSPRITSPDEAYGEVFARVLDGEMDPETAGAVRSFLSEWQQSTEDRPNSPGEFAAAMTQAHMKSGNMQAATAILDRWMDMEQGGGQSERSGSLIDLAKEGDIDFDLDTVKMLGALKFIENPRGMVRETAGGLLEASQDAPMQGQQQQQEQQQPDATSSFAQALDGLNKDEPEDAATGLESDADDMDSEPEPEEPEPSGADVGLIGTDDDSSTGTKSEGMSAGPVQEPDAADAADESDAEETVIHREGPGEEVPDPTTGTADSDEGEAVASCKYCGKPFYRETQEAAERAVKGHEANCSEKTELERTEAELRDQADPESGELPNAAEAMEELKEAAEADDEQAATDGGDE